MGSGGPSTTSSSSSGAAEEEDQDPRDDLLRPGDHVYAWRGARMRHGIVLSVGGGGRRGGGGGGGAAAVDPAKCDWGRDTVLAFYSSSEGGSGSGSGGGTCPGGGSGGGGGDAGGSYVPLGEAGGDSLPEDADAGEEPSPGEYAPLGIGDHDDDAGSDDGADSLGLTWDDAEYGEGALGGPPAAAEAVTLRVFAGSAGGTGRGRASDRPSPRVSKVRYGTGTVRRVLSRPGSASAVRADLRGLVLARARHLLECPGCLPAWHGMAANSECAAVWCRIGRFVTLQASSILEVLFVGQAGAAAAGGAIASNVMLWAPMQGAWGAAGWYWYVPLSVAYPVLVPLLVAFGLASLLPLEILRRYRRVWRRHTVALNGDFWDAAGEEVRAEYYGTTSTTDEDWMRRFFGARKGDDDAKGGFGDGDGDGSGGGRYMSLATEGDGWEGGGESDLDRRYRESLVSAYREDQASHRPEGGTLRGRQGSLLQRWRRSERDLVGEEDLGGVESEPMTERGRARRRPSVVENVWNVSLGGGGRGGGEVGLAGGRSGVKLGSFCDGDEEFEARGLIA